MAYFNLPFSVRISNENPIDGDRYLADDIASRDQIITDGRAHEGLQVYVRAPLKQLYILEQISPPIWRKGSGKELFAGTGISFVETENSITISSDVGNSINEKFTSTGGESNIELTTLIDRNYKYQIFINGVLQQEGSGKDYTLTDTTTKTTVNFEIPLEITDFVDIYYNDSDVSGPGSGDGLQNIVEDLTPQLGGTLDGLFNDIINITNVSATTYYGDGSHLTGIAAGYTNTDNKTYLDSINVVSGSEQIAIGNTTGQINISRVVGTITADSVDYPNITNLPTLVSGSSQIDHDQTTNFTQDEHFLQSEISITQSQISDFNNVAYLPLSGGLISSGSLIIKTAGDNPGGFRLQGSNDPTNIANFYKSANGIGITMYNANPYDSSFAVNYYNAAGMPMPIYNLFNVNRDVFSMTTRLSVKNQVTASAYIKKNSSGDDILLGDGTTTSLSGLQQSLPNNVVSGSLQIDHNQTTNYESDRHFLQSEISITESQISNLTHYNDTNTLTYINSQNVISGSSQLNGTTINELTLTDTTSSGQFTGSFKGNGKELYNILDTDTVGTKQTNFELSRDLGFNYKNGNFQQHYITELNDTLGGGFHGVRYVEKYKTLYACDRLITGSVYMFPNTDDLSIYSKTLTEESGYTASDQIIYSPEMDKLYIVLGDSTWSKTHFIVFEIDPVSLVATKIIDYDIGTYVGYPPFNIIGDQIYIANGYYSGKIYQFDLTSHSFVGSSAALGATAGPHNIVTDGKKLYVTSIWDYGATFIARVNPTSLVIEQIHSIDLVGTNVKGGFTDDAIEVGDYLYIPSEEHTNTGIWKVKKTNLTDIVRLDVLRGQPNSDLWGIFFDGVDIWYVGQDQTLGKFNPTTLENYQYTSPFSYNLNEIISTGQVTLVTGFDVYPVNNTGFVGKFSNPPNVSKKRVLLPNGTIGSTTDYTTGNIYYPSGQISGSFYGDGSNLTGVTSYTDVDNKTYLDSINVVSGSSQITIGDTVGLLSGSRIIGDIQASSVEYDNVLNKPTLVSGSSQIDHDQTTNFNQNEHFTQGSISITESQISDLTHYTNTDTLSYINGRNVISGSSQLNSSTIDNLKITTKLFFDSGSISYQQNSNVNTSVAEVIASIPQSEAAAVFFDYMITNTTDFRAGTIMAVHDTIGVTFTDNSTADIGDTSDITLSVDLSGPNIQLMAIALSDHWQIKVLIRTIPGWQQVNV